MIWRLFHNRRSHSRPVPRAAAPTCEALESRTVLNGSHIAAASGAAVLDHAPRYNHAVVSQPDCQPVVGMLSGTITNAANDRGMRDIPVQLIGSKGHVVRTTWTNVYGPYQFEISRNGSYVVHAATLRKFLRTYPTFVHSAPTRSGVNLPFQSPINITAPPINLGNYLTITYNNTEDGQVVNTGQDITVTVPNSNADIIDMGGRGFQLAAFHYHAPSEDRVDGKSYSREEHFVNTSASGAVTVLSVFLQLGAYKPALQPILDAASTDPSSAGMTTASTPIDFADLLPSSMQGWFFRGSLTLESSSQLINWFVFATPITLGSAQLALYQRLAEASGFFPNARLVRRLDGRQLNEFTYNVNFQNQSIAGLDFTLARRPRA
jgi:carbonic anhydrase